ncbi:MAG: thioesterase family protein [Candidatus Dormibacteria bacterium]
MTVEAFDALFIEEDGRLRPSAHTRGPWDRAAQHGGPVAAVLARAFERLATDVPMQVARITVELLRPVPLAPLHVDAAVVRPGRRVQLATASVVAGDTEVCRATCWRIRVTDVAVPLPTPQPAPPAPEAAVPSVIDQETTAFHVTGMEIRFVRGRFDEPGAATAWFRLRHPVVAGEEPTPLQRVLAAADFGNGISSPVSWFTHLFINTDLTVHVHRLPVDEWVCLDATTVVQPTGIGLAQSALSDRDGAIGRSLQSLLVDVRSPA